MEIISIKQREDEPSDNVVKLKGTSNVKLRKYQRLYQAALRDDWERGKSFLDEDSNALTNKISVRSMTALHVAAASGCWDFVENLVAKMSKEALAHKDKTGRTALHYVVEGGGTKEMVKVAKAMVNKNNYLTQLTNDEGHTPLYCATSCRTSQKNMVWYLCSVTRETRDCDCPFTGTLASDLINKIIDAGYYDIALYLIERFPNLAEENEIPKLLKVMAGEPLAFKSSAGLGSCDKLIYNVVKPSQGDRKTPFGNSVDIEKGDRKNPFGNSKDIEKGYTVYRSRTSNPVQWIKDIRDMKLKHKHALELLKCLLEKAINGESLNLHDYVLVLETATKHGILEIVMSCLHYFPDLIWKPGESASIYHVAVEYRQEEIYNLLNETNARTGTMISMKVKIKEEELPVFFLVAELPPYHRLISVPGAALQMQRELQWFTEIEIAYRTGFKFEVNKAKKTAFEVFTETHKDLRENGEKWMKETSTSCMVVSTLIATVVFAAAFTVPGGNKSDNGIPVFLSSNSFLIFAISDALALFSSITSVLIFLTILTSRFAVRDFEEWLPRRLVLGLSSLIIAIATMMISFVAALTIILNQRLRWVAIPITTFACVPVALFTVLQLPMFIRIVRTTYWRGIFRQRKKGDHWMKPEDWKKHCHISSD